jgi:hypothetical protein
VKQQDQRVMGGNASIAGVEGDQLGPQRFSGAGRHGGEESVVLRHGQHQADRLHHLSRRQIREGSLHGGDEIFHPEQLADVVLVEQHGAQSQSSLKAWVQ